MLLECQFHYLYNNIYNIYTISSSKNTVKYQADIGMKLSEWLAVLFSKCGFISLFMYVLILLTAL